jgi:small subunit ribosomal protein S20
MANTTQARKRIRQNERHASHNRPLRTRAARTLRDARAAIAAGDADAAARVREAQSAMDRAAKDNVMHPNAAARRKSRLAARLKAAGLPRA